MLISDPKLKSINNALFIDDLHSLVLLCGLYLMVYNIDDLGDARFSRFSTNNKHCIGSRQSTSRV